MSASYTVEPIGQQTIDLAYPLARISGSSLTPGEWRDYCHSFILTIRNVTPIDREQAVVGRYKQGYVRGL